MLGENINHQSELALHAKTIRAGNMQCVVYSANKEFLERIQMAIKEEVGLERCIDSLEYTLSQMKVRLALKEEKA